MWASTWIAGWPGDNYEVGLAMPITLAERGYRYGLDYLFCDRHDYPFICRDHHQPVSCMSSQVLHQLSVVLCLEAVQAKTGLRRVCY